MKQLKDIKPRRVEDLICYFKITFAVWITHWRKVGMWGVGVGQLVDCSSSSSKR